MSSGEDTPPRRPDRRMLLVGAATALALMVLIVVTTAKSPPILHAPDRDPNIHIRYGRFTPPTPPGASRSSQSTSAQPANSHAANALGTILLDIVLGLLLLGLLWLLAAIVVAAIRRFRDRRRTRLQGPLPDVGDAVLDAVAEAARRQEGLLLDGAPSNAVVACWVDLEQSVAAVGVERRPSETSAELTIRVLNALDVDRTSLRTLGALYREARFSAHPLTEEHRTAALDALRTLRSSLPATQERV
ncbi:DUF4129 domain-containing protein [Flexivirga sp.]|uniref:DUF4129 domain-containing protein n=1 Tax=Flexivirga sp. TaxID=1962927 RepID=UPI003F81EE0E